MSTHSELCEATAAIRCVNSVAHHWGPRPYKNIPPAESLFTAVVANGEGWHNWHHSYPFDYAASQVSLHSPLLPLSLVPAPP